MSSALKSQLVSVEDYLAGELVSKTKHEYLGGVIYAMTGARNQHNLIAGNVFAFLHTRLRNTPCRPFNSDTKVRVRLPTQVRFYYPDTSVVCRPNALTDSFQDEPVVIVEVLSGGTRRIDEGEKKDAYLTIPSLSVYLLIEQETPGITAFRRSDQGFAREFHSGMDAVIPLSEIGCELALSDVYDGVRFEPESAGDEGEQPD